MAFPFALVRYALLAFNFFCHSILVVLLTLAITKSGGDLQPVPATTLILDWAAMAVITISLVHQLITRNQKHPAIRNTNGISTFGFLTILGLAAVVHDIFRFRNGGFCGNFSGMTNSCAIASLVLVLVIFSTLSALAGLILSFYDVPEIYKVSPFPTDYDRERGQFKSEWKSDIYSHAPEPRAKRAAPKMTVPAQAHYTKKTKNTYFDPDRFVHVRLDN